jgi:pimeloyl-ACP methyl ester carboxylesterase
MHVHESGTPGSPAVVFLHGAGASGAMWREHMAALTGFHRLAPDLPGFGRSNHLPFLSRTVTALVVGLSWGGGIVHTLLDRHPGLVERAVIDGAGVLTWWAGGLVLAGVGAVAPFLHTRPVTALFSRIIGMDEQGRADLRAASPTAFRRAFVEGFRSGVSRVEIGASSPVLLVAGEKETAIRPANAALASLMPHAVAMFAPDLPHGWIARRTGLHVRMVEAWLTGGELPSELRPDAPDPTVVRRLLRELGAEA